MTPAQLWAIYWNGDVISSHRSFSDFIASLIKLYSRFSPNRAPGTARDERTCLHIHQTRPSQNTLGSLKAATKLFINTGARGAACRAKTIRNTSTKLIFMLNTCCCYLLIYGRWRNCNNAFVLSKLPKDEVERERRREREALTHSLSLFNKQDVR